MTSGTKDDDRIHAHYDVAQNMSLDNELRVLALNLLIKKLEKLKQSLLKEK